MPTFAEPILHPLAVREFTVSSVERIARRMVRVRFAGKDLESLESLSPTDHFKLFVQLQGERWPDLPRIENDRLVMGASGRPQTRDYTIRAHDPDRGTVDVDIAIHGDGRISQWAERAKPGDRAASMGPRGSHLMPGADIYILIGDASSLPAISRWIEEAPSDSEVHAVVAIHDEGDQIPLDSAAPLTMQWVHAEGSAVPADRLPGVVESLPLPAGDRWIWAAGEVLAMRRVRDVLAARGVDGDEFHVQGYWRRGAQDYDHHAPLDDD